MSAVPSARSAKLLHRGLRRVELFDFPPEALDPLEQLLRELEPEQRSALSLHAPMPRPGDFPFPGVACFFLNEDPSRRRLSLRLLEDTLRLARAWRAEYVVTHLTYGPTDTADEAVAGRLAADACRQIAERSREWEVPVHIEFAAYTRAFHAAKRFVDVVGPFPELGLCIDTGHAFLGAERHARDYLDDIRLLAPLARSMHLWNTRGTEDYRAHGHTPLHPSQSVADGWVDIEGTLETVLPARPDIPIVFEYPVAAVTPAVQAGYDWVAGSVARINAEGVIRQE